MDPSATQDAQFIALKDLVTFPGQMLVAGTFAEILKRIWADMPDSLNRLGILGSAVVVNWVVSLSQQAAPVGAIAWASLALLALVNGSVIALSTMKSIEFIAERKAREVTTAIAVNGTPPPKPPPKP